MKPSMLTRKAVGANSLVSGSTSSVDSKIVGFTVREWDFLAPTTDPAEASS